MRRLPKPALPKIPDNIGPEMRLFIEVTIRLTKSIMPDTDVYIFPYIQNPGEINGFQIRFRSLANDIQFYRFFTGDEFSQTRFPVRYIYTLAADFLMNQFRYALRRSLIPPSLYDFAIRCLNAFRI